MQLYGFLAATLGLQAFFGIVASLPVDAHPGREVGDRYSSFRRRNGEESSDEETSSQHSGTSSGHSQQDRIEFKLVVGEHTETKPYGCSLDQAKRLRDEIFPETLNLIKSAIKLLDSEPDIYQSSAWAYVNDGKQGSDLGFLFMTLTGH